MPRAVSLFLPMWSVDLLRRRTRTHPANAAPADSARHPRAILLFDLVSQKQVVLHCCAAARAAGIRPGMALADARALLPPSSPVVLPHNPQRDLAALRSLAQWALRFSPLVSLDPPDGLLLDISGCARLFRGEPRLLRRLTSSLARLGIHARAAAAPTFACAWGVARFTPAPHTIIPDPGARATLEPLPIAALNVPRDIIDALDEVGVTTIAHLLRLPRASLPSRFGHHLLLRLDQALGHALEVVSPVAPLIPLRLERLFDGPTTQLEAIQLAAHELLTDLVARLAEIESGVLRLVLLLERPAAEPVRLLLTLGRPSRNLKHLWALLRPRLESANLGFGVERLELTATRTARLRHEQTACWHTPASSRAQTDAAFWEFADTVTSRLGPDSLLHPKTRSTFLPERTFRWRSVLEAQPRAPSPAAAGGRAGGSENWSESDGYAPLVADRPSLLLDPPEPIDIVALTPDGPVMRLVWRNEAHAVLHSSGPERLAPEWWRHALRDSESLAITTGTRDYFKLHTDTHRTLWVFKDEATARWHLHGEWT